AEAELRTALGLHKRLATEFPAVPKHRENLAVSHINLGLLLAAMKKWDQAEAEYRTAIDLGTKLTAEFPAFQECAITLGGTFCNLGDIGEDGGRLTDGVAWYCQAIGSLSA